MLRFCIIVILGLEATRSVCATTINLTDRQSLLLTNNRMVVQTSRDTLALYTSNGQSLATFSCARVSHMAADILEEHIVVGGDEGDVKGFRLTDGALLWKDNVGRGPAHKITDVCLSGDQRSSVVSDFAGKLVVFDVFSGARRFEIDLGEGVNNIMSAALSSDGSRGVFVVLSGQVYDFVVASRIVKATGVRGSWPVRCSSDGRFYAMPSSNSGRNEALRVLDADSVHFAVDLGSFSHIGSIRAAHNGTFIFVGEEIEGGGRRTLRGDICDPVNQSIKSLWRRESDGSCKMMAYDEREMIGVSTDYRYITRVIDLSTGKEIAKLDHSAAFIPRIVTDSKRGVVIDRAPIALAICGLGIVAWIIWRGDRSRRNGRG